jgi:hypothetical protein
MKVSPSRCHAESKHRRPSSSRSWRIRNVTWISTDQIWSGERSWTVPFPDVGDTFTMKMHRLGDDYLMINYVVEFEPDRRIFWEPAPGDPSRAEGDDPSKVGIPAGYRWGYILTPDGDDATVVTEVFDYGPLEEIRQSLLRDGGTWINGANSVLESMKASLERLEKVSIE